VAGRPAARYHLAVSSTLPDMTPSPALPAIRELRQAEIRAFVRRRYGLRGTIALHRAAFGLDLLRAPVNVLLSPVFLLSRLVAALLSACGAKRAGRWLADRRIFLTSDVSRVIEADLNRLIEDLAAKGLGPDAPPDVIRETLANHVETRNAVAEITTTLFVLLAGFLIFGRATPGVMSMAGPVAELRAHAAAVEQFALGNSLGRLWYGVFPVALSPWMVAMTGFVLAALASVVTTFAGVIADPVQLATGTHRRRLTRLLDRLDEARPSGIEREHILARIGDLSDAALSLWRTMRG
jgi:hypothetical protein